MFITEAYAQGGGAPEGSFLISMLPLFAIFAIFYFIVLRPQQTRMRKHQTKISAVRRGDNVVTSGGIVGKVTRVIDDERLEVQIARDVKVEVVKSMLADVTAKGEPANKS